MSYNERTVEQQNIDPVWESILDLNVDIAEINYYASLNADDRKEIFVDPFVDLNNISSSNQLGISTGQNGNVKLGKNVLKDDFESGSSNVGWENISNFDIVSSNNLEGSNVLETFIGDGGYGGTNYQSLVNPIESDVFSFTMNVYYKDINSGGNITGGFSIADDSYSTQILSFGENHNGELCVSETGQQFNIPVSTDTSFTFDVNVDIINSEITITASNESTGDTDTVTVSTSITRLSRMSIVGGSGVGEDITLQWDNLPYDSEFYNSGSLITGTINKSYTPTSISFDADVETSSNTSVQATISDGSGNEVIFPESALGDEQSLSFDDGDITIQLDLSSTSSTETPVVNDIGARFKP